MKGGVILAFLAGFSFIANAAVSKDRALELALTDCMVKKSDIISLKIDEDTDDDIPVYKIEFETDYGDFDYSVGINSGKFVDIDYEIDEDKLRFLNNKSARPISINDAKRLIARKIKDDNCTIKIKTEGDGNRQRYDGYAFSRGMKYEFEIDKNTGIIFDFTADRQE